MKKEKFDWKNPSKKQWKQIHAWTRTIIQIFFFVMMPSIFTTAFSGVKYIFTRLGTGEAVSMTAFVTVLAAICLYTIVFGRFFCGFACAFGSVGDWLHALYLWINKKAGKKKTWKPDRQLMKWLSYVKYAVLALIVILCFTGFYGKTSGWSPWDVFSMLRSGNLRLAAYIPGLILLILIFAGMFVEERFFCKVFCPMGAVFSLLPILPLYALFRDRQNCLKGCSACTRMCPADLELPERGSFHPSGHCFQCQKCIDTCPKGNVRCGVKEVKGNELLFTLIRAIILFALMKLAGV